MKKFITLLLGLFVVVFMSSPASAGGAPQGAFKKGVITAYDQHVGTILFTPHDAQEAITMKLDTSVNRDEIVIGKRVIVSLDGEDQGLVKNITRMFIDLNGKNIGFILFVGFVGGLVSGFIGSGGAFVLTPGMMSLGVPAAVAVASNMCHKFPKAMVGAYKRWKYGQVDLKLGLIMGLSAVVGVQIGIEVQEFIFNAWGDAGSNLYVSVAFVLILVTVGGYVFHDAIKISRNNGQEQVSKLALAIQKINIPPMVELKTANVRISVWFTVPVGFATGLMAATIAVGGFVGVPGMMYVIGASGLVSSATELVVAFTMGFTGSLKWSMAGLIDIRLTLLILATSLFGVQLGALGTTYVKEYMIKVVMGTIMLIVAVSRGLAIPKYLTDLGLLSLQPATTVILMKTSFAVMAVALLAGAVIILKNMIRGMVSDRQGKVETITSHVK